MFFKSTYFQTSTHTTRTHAQTELYIRAMGLKKSLLRREGYCFTDNCTLKNNLWIMFILVYIFCGVPSQCFPTQTATVQYKWTRNHFAYIYICCGTGRGSGGWRRKEKSYMLETLPLFFTTYDIYHLFILWCFLLFNSVCIPWCTLSLPALFGEDGESSMGGFGGSTVILNICLTCRSDAEVRLVNMEQDLSNIPFNMCTCCKLWAYGTCLDFCYLLNKVEFFTFLLICD